MMLSLALAGVYAVVTFAIYATRELWTIFGEELKAQPHRIREALTLLFATGVITGIGGSMLYVGINAFREIAGTF